MDPSPSTDPEIRVVRLNRLNWEAVLELRPDEDQKDYLPDNLYSIAQSKFENCTPFGILQGAAWVGFIMYCNFDGICWINRIMVDYRFQKHGIGRKALDLMIKQLRLNPGCQEIRTSFVQHNALAEYLFKSAGFRRIGEPVGDEIVMYLPR